MPESLGHTPHGIPSLVLQNGVLSLQSGALVLQTPGALSRRDLNGLLRGCFLHEKAVLFDGGIQVLFGVFQAYRIIPFYAHFGQYYSLFFL